MWESGWSFRKSVTWFLCNKCDRGFGLGVSNATYQSNSLTHELSHLRDVNGTGHECHWPSAAFMGCS